MVVRRRTPPSLDSSIATTGPYREPVLAGGAVCMFPNGRTRKCASTYYLKPKEIVVEISTALQGVREWRHAETYVFFVRRDIRSGFTVMIQYCTIPEVMHAVQGSTEPERKKKTQVG